MAYVADSIDVIVRMHDPSRLFELKRCIFSLATQTYPNINVILSSQRFSQSDIECVTKEVEPLLQLNPGIRFSILNFCNPKPPDARSLLINNGVKSGKSRYLAFLDYDDILYHNAYEVLIEELDATKTGIAFGGINVKYVSIFEDSVISIEKRTPFKGKDQKDLFKENFCPIHSFVIDRTVVPAEDIFFEEDMTRHEDYDFLIRICAKYRASFRLIKMMVGTYFLKTDGSNTIITNWSDTKANKKMWSFASYLLQQRRKTTIISKEVQEQLGLTKYNPKLKVSDII